VNADYATLTACTRDTIKSLASQDWYPSPLERATAANGALSLWTRLTYGRVVRDRWEADQLALTDLVNGILRESP